MNKIGILIGWLNLVSATVCGLLVMRGESIALNALVCVMNIFMVVIVFTLSKI